MALLYNIGVIQAAKFQSVCGKHLYTTMIERAEALSGRRIFLWAFESGDYRCQAPFSRR
jgi:N-acetylglutamate synthase-like GNAT family acetyltransferase